MYDVVIVGGGGLGREFLMWAEHSLPPVDFRIKGYLALCPEPPGMAGLPWLGDENTYQCSEADRFLFAIGSVPIKKRVVGALKAKGAVFLTLIHNSALVASSATIGEGVVICPFGIVSDCAALGSFVTMNYNASCAHDSRVGDYSILTPYAALGGGAVLEEGGFIGMNATIAPYVKVGAGSKVAANSVVLRDTPPNTLTIGVPGRSMAILDP